MTMQTGEQLRDDIRRIIGRDFFYVSVSDEARHFDGAEAALIYAGHLFLLFMEKALGKLGEKLGEGIQKKLAECIRQIKPSPTKNEEQLLRDMDKASGAFVSIAKELTDEYVATFVSAGRDAVRERLLKDNFPREKAERFASEITDRIRNQIGP